MSGGVVRDKAKVIEDLEFLDESKCGAFEAAERTGFPTAEALEKWLERNDAYDLWLSFKRRDPVGAHEPSARRMTAVPTPKTDPILAVLDAADESARAGTRRKAERVRALLAEIRDAVTIEAADDERKTAAKAEIERLEKALAEARANLRGGGQTIVVADDSVSAAELRAWAKRKGIPCSVTGRIPAAVYEQYAAENDDEAAS